MPVEDPMRGREVLVEDSIRGHGVPVEQTRGWVIRERRRSHDKGSREVSGGDVGSAGPCAWCCTNDGAAARGCGVCWASTFNPLATQGEEGQLHRI